MATEAVNITALQEDLTTLQRQMEVANQNNDIFFKIIMGVVVYMFQCGFAFLEAGSVRSKNTTNILLKNLMDTCFGAIVYWGIGWAFAFGRDSGGFIGYSGFFLAYVPATKFGLWWFHFVYAATASTIVSGAVAERLHFTAYIAYCVILTGFIFPVVEHWVWSEHGWLNTNGFVDFAGSGVVHMLGGTCAFVGAVMLGPRLKMYRKDGKELPMLGHSVPLVALGGFILIFGFFCFNAGSVKSISSPGMGAQAAMCVVNTIVSGGAAGIVVLAIVKVRQHRFSMLESLNGCLTGMVAICAGCNTVYPWGAMLTGLFAGINYWNFALLVEKMGVDDPLNATAVHFGGGSWGLIAVTFFHSTKGILLNFKTGRITDSFKFLGWNILGLIAIAAWTGVLSFFMFLFLKLIKKLRVTPEVEVKGLDIFKHTEPAYPTAAYGHGWDDGDWKSFPDFNHFKASPSMKKLVEVPSEENIAENPETEWLRDRKPEGRTDKAKKSDSLDGSQENKTNNSGDYGSTWH